MDGGTIGTRAHRFTVFDYHRMAEVGILDEDARVELIKGQIVDMAPVGAPHLAMVNRLNRLLSASVGDRGIISVQNPVRLDDGSEPEPDIAVLKPRADEYESGTPGPDAVLLLIEVSDSTLRYDRDFKIPLYAESGILECWLLDIPGRALEIYRKRTGGRYLDVRRIGSGGIVDIEALPGVTLAASDVFGPGRG